MKRKLLLQGKPLIRHVLSKQRLMVDVEEQALDAITKEEMLGTARPSTPPSKRAKNACMKIRTHGLRRRMKSYKYDSLRANVSQKDTSYTHLFPCTKTTFKPSN